MSGTVLVEQQTAAAGSAIRAPEACYTQDRGPQASSSTPNPVPARTSPPLRRIRPDHQRRRVLSLLGPSGCGKSTFSISLSRTDKVTIGGFGPPRRAGHRGQQERGCQVSRVAALFPWLTAQKNVEVGLSIRVGRAERRERRGAQDRSVGCGRPSAVPAFRWYAPACGHRPRPGIRPGGVRVRRVACCARDAQTRVPAGRIAGWHWEPGENKKTIPVRSPIPSTRPSS